MSKLNTDLQLILERSFRSLLASNDGLSILSQKEINDLLAKEGKGVKDLDVALFNSATAIAIELPGFNTRLNTLTDFESAAEASMAKKALTMHVKGFIDTHWLSHDFNKRATILPATRIYLKVLAHRLGFAPFFLIKPGETVCFAARDWAQFKKNEPYIIEDMVQRKSNDVAVVNGTPMPLSIFFDTFGFKYETADTPPPPYDKL